MKNRKNNTFLKRFFESFLFIGIIAAGVIGYKIYRMIYTPNVSLNGQETAYLFIPTGSTFDDVTQMLVRQEYIEKESAFIWVAERKNYQNHIHPGRYRLRDGMTNNELVNLLRSGDQEPVNLIFNNIRLKQELASRIAQQIEADSTALLSILEDTGYIGKLGFTPETVIAMFIPNTYEFNWNTSEEEFLHRMKEEYERFWNEKRSARAKQIGLSKVEVATLASIVQQETRMPRERPVVAGVYINRLNKGKPLQADPTVVFALQDFTVRRVLKVHTEIDSPYNTYKYKGLPPGPICMPDISAMDAVLNYEKHNYIYFCAKEDFSGYHNFAQTYAQHLLNAAKYRNALNKRKIYN